MQLYRIDFNAIIDAWYQAFNTKDFFDNWLNKYTSSGGKVIEAIEIEESKILEEVMQGNLAIFDVSAKQVMGNVFNARKLGFDILLAKPMQFNKLKEKIEKDCV